MLPTDIIKSGLEYIEQNLKTTITAEELAKMAGYSVWHYCRVFAQSTSMTVAYYICKRRVDSAFEEIAGGRKAVDAVLEYGFDTYAGFYKAFVRMYGCSPKKYIALYGNKLSTGNGGLNMSTEQELREILANWDIPQDLPIQSKLNMGGTMPSATEWFIGDAYMLRNAERDILLKNLRMEKALATQGFSAGVLCTKSGEEFLDGTHICTLTSKPPGKMLDQSDRFGENRRDFGFKYGASIAKLHRALADVEPDVMPDAFDLYKVITEWSLPRVQEQNKQYNMGLSDDFFEDYIKSFGALFGKLPQQLIHRDPNPSNILFDNGEVSGFINFDLSERNIRLWDPCYCASGILAESFNVLPVYQKWLDVFESVLRGYDSVNPLTYDEKQAVYYAICSVEIICVAWFEVQDDAYLKELAKIARDILCCTVESKERIISIF